MVFTTYLIIDKPRPTGTQGNDAEVLADKMLSALNKPAYDSLEFIGFTFKGIHSYAWDKKSNNVTVKWNEQEVFLDLNQNPEGFNLLEYKAYQYFINDTFWLVAPFKVKDKGGIRSTVDTDEGKGLLVTYTQGGVTPGDTYLWILDERGFPTAWKLWVDIVPVGGLEFSWENWREVEDVFFSLKHESLVLDLEITNLVVR